MLKVGQVLWWVPSQYSHRRTEYEVTVTKVGRKWADLDNRHRIDMATMEADGGQYSSPGRCYVDKEAYLAEKERWCLWGELSMKITHTPPNNVTTADITAAAALLKIEIGGKG